MRIRHCGDAMLLVEFTHAIDPVTNERIILLARRIRARGLQGVLDVSPAYCTLAVYFDPLRTDLPGLEGAIESDTANLDSAPPASAEPIEIPVRYGGQWGPDLDAVAAHAGCLAEEVVARHLARTYRVYMMGFLPGFAYMGRIDPSIALPRLRVPREHVAAGSVGIAGEQTGVYPIDSPGGWHVIGWTPTTMFDVQRAQPSLLASGNLVRFVRDEESPA